MSLGFLTLTIRFKQEDEINNNIWIQWKMHLYSKSNFQLELAFSSLISTVTSVNNYYFLICLYIFTCEKFVPKTYSKQ